MEKSKRRRNYTQRHTEGVDQQTLLMDAAVKVVAAEGLENASTRAIASAVSPAMSDAVIYRYFGGKDELLLKAFLRSMGRLYDEVRRRSGVLMEFSLPFEYRLRFFWHSLWTWITAHGDEGCLMVRFLVSSGFNARAVEEYRAIWRPLADKIQGFYPDIDTSALMSFFVETLLVSSYPVCSGLKEDCASASEFGFRRVLGALKELVPSIGSDKAKEREKLASKVFAEEMKSVAEENGKENNKENISITRTAVGTQPAR